MHLQQYCSHLSKFCRSTVFEEKEKVLWQFCQCLCCRHRLAKTFVIFFVIISDVFESERILHYGDGNPYHKSKVLIYQLFPRTFFVYFSVFFFYFLFSLNLRVIQLMICETVSCSQSELELLSQFCDPEKSG